MTPARPADALRTLYLGRFGRLTAWITPLALALGMVAAGGAAAPAALAQVSETRVQEFSYDPATGLLVEQVSEPDNPAIALTTTYTYDGFGNQLTSTVSGPDIVSRTTSATYSADGRFAETVTNALGHTQTHVTDPAFGNTTSLTGPNALSTTWEYDGFGRKTRELRADGTETRWTYELCVAQCPAGAVYLVSSQEFITSSSTATTAKAIEYLDALNRVFRSEGEGFDGTPVYVDTLFNARGQVDRVSKPYFQGTAEPGILWTASAYDIVGRRISVTLPDAGVESTSFDGLTTTLTNALSQTSVRVENALGELVSATDNLGYETTYTYDPFGNLLYTDAEGVVTSMTYDVRGLKTAMDDPDMGQWSYSYNALGELVSQTDAKGQVTTMAYDKLGRMVSRTDDDGGANEATTTWTYDSAPKGIGKIAGVAAPSINYAESMTYDSLGRPEVASLTFEGETYDTQAFYDAAGRADSLAYPSGFLVKSVFTSNGHLTAVTDEFSTTTYWQADTVNAEGQVTAETLGNGVTTARVYDPATSRIDSLLTTAGATTVQDLGFDFDTLGNLTARQDLRQDREEAFTYDGLNRVTETLLTDTSTLTTLATTTYGYDSLGNIQTKSDVAGGSNYIYGLAGAGPHAVSQIGAKLYSYDANGAMITGDNKTTAWTSFNKPRVITDTLNSNESLFVYGPSRARVKHRITDGGLVTNMFYVGSHYERKTRAGEDDELVHYIRAGGAVVAIYTEYRDELDAVTADKTRYLHRDHLGSVESITDETGTVTERFSYDPHGKRRETDWTAAVSTISGSETPRGFTGHEHLDAVGLIHMNGRVYDPTLGRFLSADPFVQAPETVQSFNRYSYTANNPLSYTDPSGFEFGTNAERGYGDAPGGHDGPDGTTHKDRMERGSGGPTPANGLAKAQDRFNGYDAGRSWWSRNFGLDVSYKNIEPAWDPIEDRVKDAIESILDGTKTVGMAVIDFAIPSSLAAEFAAYTGTMASYSGSLDPGLVDLPEMTIQQYLGEYYEFTSYGQSFRVYGGTLVEQQLTKTAVDSILGTQIGQIMVEVLERRRNRMAGQIPDYFAIDLTQPVPGTHPHSNYVDVTPGFRGLVEMNAGYGSYWGTPSLTQQIAHEFGHAILGIGDVGPRSMDTVNGVENPIMKELGYSSRRTEYFGILPGRDGIAREPNPSYPH
jgi:RHS repeat-associated protein